MEMECLAYFDKYIEVDSKLRGISFLPHLFSDDIKSSRSNTKVIHVSLRGGYQES